MYALRLTKNISDINKYIGRKNAKRDFLGGTQGAK